MEEVVEFVSERDLETFEGWLRYQCADSPDLSAGEREILRSIFENGRSLAANTPKLGLMKLPQHAGELRYAVAVRDDDGLWLTLWIRRSRKGELFILVSRGAGKWNPHSSYHLDGRFHMKSHDRKILPSQLQPLSADFRGTAHLGMYGGHAPRSVGALCDPSAFTGVVEVPNGILGPRDGMVVVDLVEPGTEPMDCFNETVIRKDFREVVPWLVVRVARPYPLHAKSR